MTSPISIAPLALMLVGCTSIGPGERASAAESVDGEADVDDGEAAVDTATSDAETSSDATSSDADSADAAEDDADDAPGDAALVAPVSLYCGDGVRDPITEECDDGAGGDAGVDAAFDSGAVRRSCTADCHVLDLLAIAPATMDAGPSPAGRSLGNGRHPLAGDAHGFAVAFVEPDSIPPRIALTTFDAVGKASDVVVPFGGGSTPALAAHPVIAPSGDGRFYAAWNDFDGDGDELGIAMRIVDPLAPASSAPRHANATTAFSQLDPDILAGFDSSGRVVIAWVDESSASTGPDVKARVFDRSLAPMGGELAIATTSASEADLALAPFDSTWAIAWKSAASGLETTMVQTGTIVWHTEEYRAGPSTSRPAIAQLDATHLVVVFAADDGAAGYEIRAATLDTAAPGAVTSTLVAVSTGASAADRRDPNAVRIADKLFLTWRGEIVPGTDLQDELWLKEIRWAGSALDLSLAEIRLPRWPAHTLGDQRRPALAGIPLSSGNALIAAWDDLGKTFGATEGNGDVVVELIPLPLLRLGDP
jgi:hypothetical protein